jgi:6-pyruvoyltetrahydropterin/6-carboxytetrahydropterin synthase
MFEVRVEKTIACAHRLFGYNGPCERLHGHNYRIQVCYSGTELDQWGMLVDFTDVKKAFYAIASELDHTYLNELPAFQELSPSAENIAWYVFQELKKVAFERATLRSVSVWETPSQVAVYSE